MTLTIRSASAALTAQRHFALHLSGQATSIARLSSGLRVNRAADDAAGMSIAVGMRAQVGGIRVGLRNAQDAVSMLQLGEGALASTHDTLHRLRDLAVRAASTGSMNATALAAIEVEAAELRAGLDHVAASTTFNGHQLLAGAFRANFQVGANSGDSLEVPFSTDASAAGLGLDALAFAGQMTGVSLTAGKAHFGGVEGSASTFHIALVDDDAALGFVAGLGDPRTDFTVGGHAVDVSGVATLDDLQAAIAGAGAGNVAVTRDASGITLTALDFGPTLVDVVGAPGTATAGVATVPDAGGNPAQLVATVDLSQLAGQVELAGVAKFNLASASAAVGAAPDAASKAAALASAMQDVFTDASVTVSEDGILTVTANSAADVAFTAKASGTSTTLEAIDAAIATVSGARARLGAAQNRVTHTIAVQAVALENLTAAHSRIQDADMGVEMMNLVRSQIGAQAASALIAHAQVDQRAALMLLLPSSRQ